jgi:hypothetical protein
MPKLSMKGLAQFMTAGPSRQRSILRDHKFPKAAVPMIGYYTAARNAIKRYHEETQNPAIIVEEVAGLRKKMIGASKQTVSRLENNIRALQGYLEYFGKRSFRVLETPRLKYLRGDVAVSVVPDLMVEENGVREMIKLDCNRAGASKEQIDVMLQLMYESASAAAIGVKPKGIAYIDAIRNKQHVGAKLKRTLKKDIDAACDNVSAMWPGISR